MCVPQSVPHEETFFYVCFAQKKRQLLFPVMNFKKFEKVFLRP